MNARQKIHQVQLQEWIVRFAGQKASGLTVPVLSDSDSSLETATPDIRSIRANRSIRSNNSNVQMQINGIFIEIDPSVSEEFPAKLIRAVCHA